MQRLLLPCLLLLAVVACGAPVVHAAESTTNGYSSPGEISQTQINQPREVSGGTLPFTGLDAVFLVAVGAGLLLMGLGIRVLVTRRATGAKG